MFSWLWSSHKPPRGEAPVFTEALQGQRVNHACPAVLTARLTGHPPPKVVWFQGSKELPNSPDFRQEFDEASGRICLTIAEVFVDDQGPYRAVAVNEFGKDETTAFVGLKDLEVLDRDELRQAPRITEPLKANVITAHSAVDMAAKFEAFPPPTIKWYKKGKEIKPSVEFNIEHQSNGTKLHIEEVFEDDSGEYEVRIFNDAGEARTAASLVVLKAEEKVIMEPPQFTKALAPQIVPEGEVAILDVEVRAMPEASFSWYRHGIKITDDEELEVSVTSEDNKSRLVIGEVFEDDSGDYSVTAQNEAGRASSTATLLVEGEGASEAVAPTFDPLLTPLQVMDGQQARFTCRVTGTPTPQIFWFHEGRPIGHHREVKVLQSQDGRVGLIISEVFPEDSGEYTCVARNKAGESRCTATLTVEAFEYTPDSELSTLVSPTEKVVLPDSVTEEETIESERGSSSDSDFSEIGSSPEFIERLTSRMEVIEGHPTRLLTKVTGYPRPTITWHVDGQAVRVSDGLTLENYEDGTASLSLSSATVAQCGEYTCEAQNRNGVATCTTLLSVVPSEHSEGTSSAYRKPEWVTRMEELKTAMQGRVGEETSAVLSATHMNAQIPVLSESNPRPDQLQRSTAGPLTLVNKPCVVKKKAAHTLGVQGLKATPCVVASRSLSIGLNSFPASVSSCTSSESLAVTCSISQDSLNAVRYSQSEIDSSEFGSRTTMVGSTAASTTNGSHTDKTGFASSSVSLGDLSMGSDSVFISETETLSDMSRMNDRLYKNTLMNSTYCPNPSKSGPLSPGVKHVHFYVEGAGTEANDNFAQSVLTDYLSSHRNSISQFIQSLSNEASPADDGPRNVVESKENFKSYIPLNLNSSSSSTLVKEVHVEAEGVQSNFETNVDENVTIKPESFSKSEVVELKSKHMNLENIDVEQSFSEESETEDIVDLKTRSVDCKSRVGSLSDPTTPRLARSNSIRSRPTFISRGQIFLSSNNRKSESCGTSPISTPIMNRKFNKQGSFSKIPKLILRAFSNEPEERKGVRQNHRSSSEPCTPLMSPETVRKNSKIPIRQNSFSSNDDFGSNARDVLFNVRSKVNRSASIPSRSIRSSSEEKSPLPSKRSVSIMPAKTSKERCSAVFSLPTTPVLKRRDSGVQHLNADKKQSPPSRPRTPLSPPPVRSKTSLNRKTSVVEGKNRALTKHFPSSIGGKDRATFKQPRSSVEATDRPLAERSSAFVELKMQIPSMHSSSEFENKHCTPVNDLPSLVESRNQVPNKQSSLLVETNHSFITRSQTLREGKDHDITNISYLSGRSSTTPVQSSPISVSRLSNITPSISSSLAPTIQDETEEIGVQIEIELEEEFAENPSDNKFQKSLAYLKRNSPIISEKKPTQNMFSRGMTRVTPERSRQFSLTPTSSREASPFDVSSSKVVHSTTYTWHPSVPNAKLSDVAYLSSSSVSTQASETLSPKETCTDSNSKRPEFKPSTSILEILNTDVYYRKEPKHIVDTLIETPFFDDKYVLSVRKKSSFNFGLPRANTEHVEPQFVQELVNGSVKEMGNYVFTVSFVGNPKPEITWYHDNLLIHQQQAFQMRVRGDKAYLTLVEAYPKHRGEYVCRAVNAAGEAYTKANLEVIELTYEEKLTIANERYAAINIQHAAQHMKVKERERSEKEKQAHKEALLKMKEDRQRALIEKEKELEEAKQSTWKPQRRLSEAPVVKEVEPQTPKKYCIDQVYSNWKAPIAIEESYPEIVPEEFSPSQIPGVKCFVRVSDTSIRGEEVVKEIAPRFFEDEQVIIELARVHTLLRNSVRVNEIWSLFRAGEFPALQQPSIQTALVKICEYIGHQRNVSLVLAEETKMQASQHPVGLKAFLRMLKHANNVRQDVLFKEVIPKEMGKWSTTTQELERVSQMLNQGIETEEIIACCVAGQLPQLKKPETQQPLVNIVEKQGHSVMVAQVLVEEAYRDAKEDRALAEHAWQVYHEEELAHAAVSQVEKETHVIDFETKISEVETRDVQERLEPQPYRTQPLSPQPSPSQNQDTLQPFVETDDSVISTEFPHTETTEISKAPKHKQKKRIVKRIVRSKGLKGTDVEDTGDQRYVSEEAHDTQDADEPVMYTDAYSEQSDHTQLEIGSDVDLYTMQKLRDLDDTNILKIDRSEELDQVDKSKNYEPFSEEADHTELIVDSETDTFTLQNEQDLSDSEIMTVERDQVDHPVPTKHGKTVAKKRPQPEKSKITQAPVALKPVKRQPRQTSETPSVEQVQLKPTPRKPVQEDKPVETVQLKPLPKQDVDTTTLTQRDVQSLSKALTPELITETALEAFSSPIPEELPIDVPVETETEQGEQIEPEPTPDTAVSRAQITEQVSAPSSPGTRKKIIRRKIVKKKPEVESEPEQIRFKPPKQRDLKPEEGPEEVMLKPFTKPAREIPKPTPSEPAQEKPLDLKPITIPDREDITLEYRDVESVPTVEREVPQDMYQKLPVAPQEEETPEPAEPKASKIKKPKKVIEEQPEPEPLKFKIKRRPKSPEPEPEEVHLKPIPKKEKEVEEVKPEKLAPIEKPERIEPIPEAEIPQRKTRKVIDKKDEPEPEVVQLKPTRRPQDDEKPEPEKPALKPLRKIEQHLPDEEDVKLRPIKRIPKEEETPEEVVLKPFKRKEIPKPVEDTEPVKLKPVQRPPKPEPEVEDVQLKPVKRLPKTEPEPEEVRLKPIQKPSKPEPEPEEVKLKPVQRPPKPEPEPEKVELKPFKRPEKPVPEPEEVKLKPVQRPPKPEPEPEKVELKPFKRPEKPAPEPEDVKLKPVQRPPKPEPEPEKVELKPFKRPERPAPEPEEVKLKPVQRPPKPEPEPEKVELKPFKKPEKQAPEPEEVKLKPVVKPSKPEPIPEEVHLKPIPKPSKQEPKPVPVEPVELKPIPHPKESEPELIPEQVTLKPVEKPTLPEPVPEPQVLAPATISEEKTAEEFVGEQNVKLQSVEAQRSVQQSVLETTQRSQQVQQVVQSKVQVSVEEGSQLEILKAPKQDVTVREEVSHLQQVTSEQPLLIMKESQSMASQHSESTQIMTQSVVQQQASFSQQESVMNQSIIQQTDVQKSPTVIRKVKKIIKRPKKQSTETVTTETVEEVVQAPEVVEEVKPEEPKITETIVEEVIQPKVEESTIVTEVVQQPQIYHEESTIERLVTDVKQEEQVEVKPTKVVKKKIIKKIVKKPSTEERVEVQREVEEQKTLTIEETQFIPEQEQVTALSEELPEELPETLEIAPAEPAIADTVPEPALDTHITEVVHTQTAPAQEITTSVHRVKKIIKKKKRQEVKADETLEGIQNSSRSQGRAL
ncbi:Immunoglobulin I-set [Trinorchestia longiramus]|nr:Immunoglobulin I-set [Trinorchestia longiramus]